MLEEDDLGPADRALLNLLKEGRITAPFAAEKADYSTQYVRDRLARLVEHGNARKVYQGLYELVEDPRDTPGAEEPEQTAQSPGVDEKPTDSHRDILRGALAGSDDLLERRVDEVLTMYDLLRERGQAEKDELLDAVDVDATGYASRASVWSNMVKGKDTLSALPGVESPPTGRSEWRYTDE
jgi:hypothetical protein